MKKKILYYLIIVLVVLNETKLYSQTLIIGSGLDNDTLTILADEDTIFNEVHKSLDFIDILKYIPFQKKSKIIQFYVNGSSVSRLYLDRSIVNKKIYIWIDFNFSRFDSNFSKISDPRLLSVNYKFIKKPLGKKN